MNKYLLLASKNIKKRGLRSWLTMLGIFIGIAAVVSLITLSNGLKTAIMGQFDSMGTDMLTITSAETAFGPPGSTAVRKLNEHDVEIISSVNGIKEVIPRLLRTATVTHNKISSTFYIVSMPEDSRKTEIIYEKMNIGLEEGRKIQADERGGILIGHDLKDEKKFEKQLNVGNDILVEDKTFEVAGILKKASTFQINKAIFMSEEDLKSILNIEDEYDLIGVIITEGADIEQVAEEIEKEMRRDRKQEEGEEDFSVKTPLQALQGVNSIINIIGIIVSGIAIISLLVGGIGIANTMYTSVLERFKEIGVMKAVGARNSDILKLFIFEAGMLGLVGGVIGTITGVFFAWIIGFSANSYFQEKIFIIKPSIMLLIGATIFSFVMGIIFGILPAMQASKLKPVDSIRGGKS